MTYKLTFLESAKKEWDKLPFEIQRQIKTKLQKIVNNPHIPKNKLSGFKNCYKIKLRTSGYRLVYQVYEDKIVIQVIAVGKRDKSEIYQLVHHRLEQ